MIVIASFATIVAILGMCWLLFTLAVFALPAYAGVAAGLWAHGSGAGIAGAVVVGLVAAGSTYGLGQLLLVLARPVWIKLLVALAFVSPAAVAGYHATLGIVRLAMPSETWQLTFSVVGGIAVGVTAFMRLAMMSLPDASGQEAARTT